MQVPPPKERGIEEDKEYETIVLQRLQKIASLPSTFVTKTKLDLEYVVSIFEYLAPKISPELAWTEQMKSRKANGPANVMKTLKACNLDRFLNIIAIKRISSEHNRKKFFQVLDLVADIIENGHVPKVSSLKTQNMRVETKTDQLHEKTDNDKKEVDVPSPFQKKEKLRKESDLGDENIIFPSSTDSVKQLEDTKENTKVIIDNICSANSLERPFGHQEREEELRLDGNADVAPQEDYEKSAVPTPFRSSRPREIGENAPVQVISSPSRFFRDFLEKSGFPGKTDSTWDIQDITNIQDQVPTSYKDSQPSRRKVTVCKNEVKKVNKTIPTEDDRKQVGKGVSLLEKNETGTSYSATNSGPRSSCYKESGMEVHQDDCTPKKPNQPKSHTVQTSPILRATDPSRGVNSWMKAQNTLEEIHNEVMQIMNSIDISYQVFPILLENDTHFLPFIEGRLETLNDSLQNFKRNVENSLKEVNQYIEKNEHVSSQKGIADFIKEITEEYSSPGIKSLPYLQRELDSLRQEYFQLQSQNALALVLYENETDRKLTWSVIEETFLEYEQTECPSEGFLASKEMLSPRNLILLSAKRLEKIVHKKPLYQKSAYSVLRG